MKGLHLEDVLSLSLISTHRRISEVCWACNMQMWEHIYTQMSVDFVCEKYILNHTVICACPMMWVVLFFSLSHSSYKIICIVGLFSYWVRTGGLLEMSLICFFLQCNFTGQSSTSLNFSTHPEMKFVFCSTAFLFEWMEKWSISMTTHLTFVFILNTLLIVLKALRTSL